MQSLEAVEYAYNWKMKQRPHIIQGDGQLCNKKMETAGFLMSHLLESGYKSPIASVY